MQLPALGSLEEYTKIPRLFYSYEHGKPFEKCIVCGKDLLNNGVQYVVEKAIVTYPAFNASDVVYEYAMCLSCTAAMRQALSKESLAEVERYFDKRVNLVKRREELLRTAGLNADAWIENCLIKGIHISELNEYQIYAHCDGEDLLFSYLPYMISGEALDEITRIISPKTKDILDDFIDEHFGLPPEFKELIKGRKVVLI